MHTFRRMSRELAGVLMSKKLAFVGWLAANLGGLLIAYGAVATVLIVHGGPGNFTPGVEAILITGAISVAIAGASYWTVREVDESRLAAPLVFIWPFLLTGIYGLLVAMAFLEERPSGLRIWIIASVTLLLSIVWASVTWLHEQGIRSEFEREPSLPEAPAKELQAATVDLPKLED